MEMGIMGSFCKSAVIPLRGAAVVEPPFEQVRSFEQVLIGSRAVQHPRRSRPKLVSTIITAFRDRLSRYYYNPAAVAQMESRILDIGSARAARNVIVKCTFFHLYHNLHEEGT
jgi:hypothetical protein